MAEGKLRQKFRMGSRSRGPDPEIATSQGFCCIDDCPQEDVIMPGEDFVQCWYGDGSRDFKRAHHKCALNSPWRLKLADELAASTPPAEGAAVEHHGRPDVRVIQSPITPPRRWLLLGSGHVLWHGRNKEKLEGITELLLGFPPLLDAFLSLHTESGCHCNDDEET